VAASRSEPAPSERDWWARVPLVLGRPRAVFAAMRDDSDPAAQARQEPVLAIVLLAGIAGVLSTTLAAQMLDDDRRSELAVAFASFLGGSIYGLAGYFGLGALVYLGIALAGSPASYRSARHLLAYAAVPLAASLVLWLPRLLLYGGDNFRTGGADAGAGGAAFDLAHTASVLWAVVLLAVGIRVVTGLGWGRATAATAVPAALPLAALARAYGLV
jgi:hypothetical protein